MAIASLFKMLIRPPLRFTEFMRNGWTDMAKNPAVMAWSGGKDSALALRAILRAGQHDVVALLTTCTEGFRRISMHGVRCSLLKAQAAALEMESCKVFVSPKCSNAEYEE